MKYLISAIAFIALPLAVGYCLYRLALIISNSS
jgi:hypothetical protein